MCQFNRVIVVVAGRCAADHHRWIKSNTDVDKDSFGNKEVSWTLKNSECFCSRGGHVYVTREREEKKEAKVCVCMFCFEHDRLRWLLIWNPINAHGERNTSDQHDAYLTTLADRSERKQDEEGEINNGDASVLYEWLGDFSMFPSEQQKRKINRDICLGMFFSRCWDESSQWSLSLFLPDERSCLQIQHTDHRHRKACSRSSTDWTSGHEDCLDSEGNLIFQSFSLSRCQWGSLNCCARKNNTCRLSPNYLAF